MIPRAEVIHMIFSWMLCRVYLFHCGKGLQGEVKCPCLQTMESMLLLALHCCTMAGKHLGLMQQVKEIMPLSLCFALSVAMGNLSLKYIYPSFNQMLGPGLTCFAQVRPIWPDVWLTYSDQLRIHVAPDHGSSCGGDAAEALSTQDMVVNARNLRWACSLQRERCSF